jgi:hypothetical protein
MVYLIAEKILIGPPGNLAGFSQGMAIGECGAGDRHFDKMVIALWSSVNRDFLMCGKVFVLPLMGVVPQRRLQTRLER